MTYCNKTALSTGSRGIHQEISTPTTYILSERGKDINYGNYLSLLVKEKILRYSRTMQYARYMMGSSFFLIGVLYVSTAVWSQQSTTPPNSSGDASSLIGLTLDGLFSRFGFPQSVHAVRGVETWQDDVVFVYEDQDFYVYKNRVWQIEVKAAYGIKVGDPVGVVSQILGSGITYFTDYLLYPLPGRGWPLMLRINFDRLQSVSAIFIYRSDF